jgi:hypothetical protein
MMLMQGDLLCVVVCIHMARKLKLHYGKLLLRLCAEYAYSTTTSEFIASLLDTMAAITAATCSSKTNVPQSSQTIIALHNCRK